MRTRRAWVWSEAGVTRVAFSGAAARDDRCYAIEGMALLRSLSNALRCSEVRGGAVKSRTALLQRVSVVRVWCVGNCALLACARARVYVFECAGAAVCGVPAVLMFCV